MFRSKQEWVDGQWNPITGCLNDNCDWCISKERSGQFRGDIRLAIHNNDYKVEKDIYVLDEPMRSETGTVLTQPFGFKPTYHRYRLKNLDRLKGTKNLLVCGESEMFGPWVPDSYITEILETCVAHPKNHYLFLTAYPERYYTLAKKNLLPKGEGFWYGSTQTKGFITESHTYLDDSYHRFIAVTPILDAAVVTGNIDWVIVGPDLRRYGKSINPDPVWIEGLVEECRRQNIKVFTDKGADKIVAEQFRQHDVPDILRTKELGADRDRKLNDVCRGCKKKKRKTEMNAIGTRKLRGESFKTIMFLCDDCFLEMKRNYEVDI